ncbi:MAG TPA: PAS domain-containing protein [Rhizomicrobium sp.]|nr:PAS domain-containing protein [Rhizomicrobium sp.]
MAAPRFELNPQSEEPVLLADLRRYWERKRGSRAMPSRGQVVPSEIKNLLPFVVLVDVVDGGADFRYRLVGSQLHAYFPAQPTGRLVSEALLPFGADTVAATLDVYRRVVAQRQPLRIRGDGAWYAQDPKFFEAILTPLSEDGASANMIFGVFKFVWDFATVPLEMAAAAERDWHASVGEG